MVDRLWAADLFFSVISISYDHFSLTRRPDGAAIPSGARWTREHRSTGDHTLPMALSRLSDTGFHTPVWTGEHTPRILEPCENDKRPAVKPLRGIAHRHDGGTPTQLAPRRPGRDGATASGLAGMNPRRHGGTHTGPPDPTHCGACGRLRGIIHPTRGGTDTRATGERTPSDGGSPTWPWSNPLTALR